MSFTELLHDRNMTSNHQEYLPLKINYLLSNLIYNQPLNRLKLIFVFVESLKTIDNNILILQYTAQSCFQLLQRRSLFPCQHYEPQWDITLQTKHTASPSHPLHKTGPWLNTLSEASVMLQRQNKGDLYLCFYGKNLNMPHCLYQSNPTVVDFLLKNIDFCRMTFRKQARLSHLGASHQARLNLQRLERPNISIFESQRCSQGESVTRPGRPTFTAKSKERQVIWPIYSSFIIVFIS